MILLILTACGREVPAENRWDPLGESVAQTQTAMWDTRSTEMAARPTETSVPTITLTPTPTPEDERYVSVFLGGDEDPLRPERNGSSSKP